MNARLSPLDPIPVHTVAGLTKARVALAQAVAERLGRTRSKIRLPHDYAVLYWDDTPEAVPLSRYAAEQAERIRNNDWHTFQLRLAPGILRWLETQ